MSTTPTALPASAPPDLSGLTGQGSSFGQGAPDVGGVAPIDTSAPQAPTASEQAAQVQQYSPANTPANVGGYTSPGMKPGIDVNQGPAAPPQPHAKLLSMIQGLALGMSNFGKAMGSGGKEGGASGVIADTSEIENQKIRAQQATQSATTEGLKQQALQGEINTQTGVNHFNLLSMGDRLDAEHFKAQEAKQGLQKNALDIDTQIAGYQRENYGLMPPSQVSGGTPGTPGAPSNTPVTPEERARVQTSLGSAINLGTGVLGTTQDPTLSAAIDRAKAVVANPNASRADILGAGQGLTNALQVNKAVVASRKEQADAASAENTAANAPAKSQADIALAKARTGAATTSTQKTASELKALQTGNSNLSGPEYLKSLPASRASNVQAFGEGRAQVNSRSFATPAGQALLSDITAAYPDYDQSKAVTWDKTRNEYTGSGATAKKAVSYNTALEHMQDLYNNSTKEGLYLPASKAYSDRSVALGYVSNEVGNAIKNGVMSKDEGAQILDSLKGWTPSTAKERVAETARLLYDKIEEYQTKFADAAPSSAVKVPTLISPKAQSAYNFVEGINQTPAAPNTHVFNATTWATAHPGQNVNAAIAQARAAGYQVKQ